MCRLGHVVIWYEYVGERIVVQDCITGPSLSPQVTVTVSKSFNPFHLLLKSLNIIKSSILTASLSSGKPDFAPPSD